MKRRYKGLIMLLPMIAGCCLWQSEEARWAARELAELYAQEAEDNVVYDPPLEEPDLHAIPNEYTYRRALRQIAAGEQTIPCLTNVTFAYHPQAPSYWLYVQWISRPSEVLVGVFVSESLDFDPERTWSLPIAIEQQLRNYRWVDIAPFHEQAFFNNRLLEYIPKDRLDAWASSGRLPVIWLLFVSGRVLKASPEVAFFRDLRDPKYNVTVIAHPEDLDRAEKGLEKHLREAIQEAKAVLQQSKE